MRHRVAGKQLSRTSSHRKALRRNMAASLIQHGAIRTTEAKAKELRRFVERLITIAKAGTLQARRRVLAKLGDRDMFDNEGELVEQTLVQKLFSEIAPQCADRPGGYTRIIRISDRRIGDAGRQVILQLVGQMSAGKAGEKTSRRRRRTARRQAAAEQAAEQAEEKVQPQDQKAEEQKESAEEADKEK